MAKISRKCSNDCGSGGTWSWVEHEVLNTKSIVNVADLIRTRFPQPKADHANVSFSHCTNLDRVCYGAGEEEQEQFFFVYKTLFTDLMLPLPFSDFQMRLLNKINVAPTQLHPHAWTFVRCFELLCQFHKLTPTVPTFFYFFHLVEKKKGSWLHIHARQSSHKLLVLDLRCFGFKENFFKIKGDAGGGSSVPFFMDQNKNPQFPLCWSKFVKFPDPPAFRSLSDSEKDLVTKLEKLKDPFSCFSLINDGESESEEGEEEDEKVKMRPKRKEEVLTRGRATEKMKKKKKVSVENNASPSSPPLFREQNIAADIDMENVRDFEGEGRVLSLWDRGFDFDHHVQHYLFSSPDQDKLRRLGHARVGRFMKLNALRIAAGTEFLVEELEKKEKELCSMMTKLEKAEREVAKCLGELERAKKESEYTELSLMREWKRSVRISFQNAVDQVRLGFPKLNMDSIMLDPFKVVEGGKLVDMKSRSQHGAFAL